MKKNTRKKVYLSFLFLSIFAYAFQLTGCDSTRGKFLPTSPSGDTLTLSVNSASIAANNTDLATITATVTGRAAGAVSFSSDKGTLSATEINVNSSGVAEVTIKSSIVGPAIVTATAGVIVKTISVNFSATNSLFVTSITSTAGGVPAEVDTFITTCATGNEKFIDEEATVTISNIGPQLVNITDYTIRFVGRDTTIAIPSYGADIVAQIAGEGGTATLVVNLMKAGSSGQSGTKLWYSSTYGNNFYYTYDADYTFTGVDLTGNPVTVSGDLEIKLGEYVASGCTATSG